MAAKHNFPITHHICNALVSRRAHGPSIQSGPIDLQSVFACVDVGGVGVDDRGAGRKARTRELASERHMTAYIRLSGG